MLILRWGDYMAAVAILRFYFKEFKMFLLFLSFPREHVTLVENFGCTPKHHHPLWYVLAVLDRCTVRLVTTKLQSFYSALFFSKFNNFGTNLAATHLMPKTSDKIAWHKPIDMPTSSVTFLAVIWQLSTIILFTFST